MVHIIFFIVTELGKHWAQGRSGYVGIYVVIIIVTRLHYLIKFFPMWSFVTVISIPIAYMTVRDTVVKPLKCVRGAGT